jgi:pyruvate carboxylase
MLQPDTGRIQAYRSPGGPGIRLDGALGAGNTVSRYYDSLLTKVHSRMAARHCSHAAARDAVCKVPFRNGVSLAANVIIVDAHRSFAMANPTFRQSRRCSARSVSPAAVPSSSDTVHC